MSITGTLAAFSLRYTCNVSADALIGWIADRFADHSLALPNALKRANDSAWKVVGLALAGDTLIDRVKDSFRDRDLTALRDQIRAFLANAPTGLEMSPAGLRVRACDELNQLRKSGSLSHAPDASTVEANLRRFGDAAKLVTGAERAIAEIADSLAVKFPHLAQVLRLAPADGTPLLASAFLFFFRREVETDATLSRNLTFDSLRTLTAEADRGFTLLDDRTVGILDQFDVLFDALGTWFAAADSKLEDIRGKLDKLLDERNVPTGTHDPLKVSVTNEKELAQLRHWRDDLRKLPPELLEAADWSKLGDALAAGRMFVEAQEAHKTAARSAADRASEAEAEFKAYRDACEQELWDDALRTLVRAAELDPARFAPFPLKRYEPIAILGAGGFGTVIRCRQRLAKGREVAVKTFHPADLSRDIDDIFSEAHTLSELVDPAIVKIIHWDFADPADSRPYLVMEYFPGTNLAAYLKQYGQLEVTDFIGIARQIAEGMEVAHASNILHRDMKPGNVLIRQLGAGEGGAASGTSRWDVRVIDFGLAVRLTSVQASISTSIPHRTRRDQSFVGTLEYASPEQKGIVHAEIGPRSDVYSFGKTMMEALLGTTEPTTRNWKTVPDEYREPLQELLERCVEKNPSERHPGFEVIVGTLAGLDPAERANRERREHAAEHKPHPDQAERVRLVSEKLAAETARREEEERWQAERAERELAEAKRTRTDSGKSTPRLWPLGRAREEGEKLTFNLPGDIPMTFAWCPPGTFRMGSTDGQSGEKPVHTVTLSSGFFMGTVPVTQSQWRAMIDTSPSHFRGAERPVEQVSWTEATEFCRRLTARLEGKALARLPTEAEWEYACRAGTTTEYNTGDGEAALARAGWYLANSGKETHAVGRLAANAWGLSDMHGNVWEWVHDWKGDYPALPVIDPTGPRRGSHRVLRGGSWDLTSGLCRSAVRSWFVPAYRSFSWGFRVALVAPG